MIAAPKVGFKILLSIGGLEIDDQLTYISLCVLKVLLLFVFPFLLSHVLLRWSCLNDHRKAGGTDHVRGWSKCTLNLDAASVHT